MSISFETGHDYEAKTEDRQGEDAEPIAVFEDEGSDEGVSNHQGPSGAKSCLYRGEVEFVFHKRNRLQGDIA
jgi:hypothetical protein